MLTATTSKRLQITQAQLQNISYAQEHNQETSYAQAQLQETYIQTELQTNLFEVEHLIMENLIRSKYYWSIVENVIIVVAPNATVEQQ